VSSPRRLAATINTAVPQFGQNHTSRATGIAAYLLNGGSLEHAQPIAAHQSPRTTKLYDRTGGQITLVEVGRIVIKLKLSHFLPKTFRVSSK